MREPPGQLGPYPVERELGRGGMGVVYLARDPKLNRAVAIKVLPDALALNPESLARFEREAKLLASLNHPNIATIYGVEEALSTGSPRPGSGQAGQASGQRLLILEYVPGDTLATRIGRGPLAMSEALDVGRQVALAVEAAHEGGVIHRDLKPGNIKVTPDGVVKVLDFGLAKGATVSDAELAHSPTITYAPTGTGVILGTAGYMSPEQARGKPVDRRTDIWSFGCVLFECLAGKQIFEGETVSDTIAKILEREPDWAALPAKTPPRIRELLRRCLEKDLKKRQRDMGDVRIELDEAVAARSATATAVAVPASSRARFSLGNLALAALLVALGAVAGAGLWRAFGPRPPVAASRPIRLSINVPPSIRALGGGLTPNGRDMLIAGSPRSTAGEADPALRVYARSLDGDEFRPIPGTEDSQGLAFSPDGAWLAVVSPIAERASEHRLMKVPMDGSAPPVALVDWDNDWSSPIWLENGDILIMSDGATKYFRLPPGGGGPTPPVAIDFGGAATTAHFQSALPGDRGVFMQAIVYNARGYQTDEWVLDLKTNKAHRLIENGSGIAYAPTGHVVFSRGETLMAAPFSLDTLTVTGGVTALSGGLRMIASWANGGFSLARDGTLVYPPGGRVGLDRRIVTLGPTGAVTPFGDERREYDEVAISRDGRRVAVVVADLKGTYETWIADQERPAFKRALSVAGADCDVPLWSPDGQTLAYMRTGNDQDDGAYVQRVDGGAPQLVMRADSRGVRIAPVSWAPDGSALIVSKAVGGRNELLWAPIGGGAATAKPRVLHATTSSQIVARISPDGRLVAFDSDESGKVELYVATFGVDGSFGLPLMVSNGVSTGPFWAADGRRLFYGDDGNRKVMVATIGTMPALSASTPAVAFDLETARLTDWGVLPDGRVLGIQKPEGADDIPSFTVVLNWFTELRARMEKQR